MHATASRRLHLLPQPALPTLFRFQQSDGLAATACVPDVLRLPKGKPLHFTARSHPQTHGKNGTSARAPAFAQPFPPAHTPVCPKTAFISANARLPLSGRRRQAPAAKHPSLRLDDCGLPAITTLFHPHRNIALTACRRVRRVSEPMDTSKTARRPPRSRLRRPFLPLGPPPQPGTASAQRYRFPLLSGAAPFRRSSFPAQLRRLSGPSNAAARPFSAAFCAAAECDKNPVRAYGILYRQADAKEDGAHPLFGVRAVLWRKRGEKR